MTKQEREKYIEYMLIRQELEEEKKNGFRLAFSGKETSADEIARICAFEEETAYMRDYIVDKKQNIKSLNFEPVSR